MNAVSTAIVSLGVISLLKFLYPRAHFIIRPCINYKPVFYHLPHQHASFKRASKLKRHIFHTLFIYGRSNELSLMPPQSSLVIEGDCYDEISNTKPFAIVFEWIYDKQIKICDSKNNKNHFNLWSEMETIDVNCKQILWLCLNNSLRQWNISQWLNIHVLIYVFMRLTVGQSTYFHHIDLDISFGIKWEWTYFLTDLFSIHDFVLWGFYWSNRERYWNMELW